MAVEDKQTEQNTKASQQDSKKSGQSSSGGGSRAGAALKVGALAAAAGGAALVAGKAMSGGKSSGGGGGEGRNSARQNGGSGAGGRASLDKVVQAVGQGRWDVLKDVALPFAENGATSAGTYVAKQGPEILTERLLPKFIDAFNEERGKSSSSA